MTEYEFTWGWKYLIYFSYYREDRGILESFSLRFKHQIKFSILNYQIISIILRSASKGIVFIRNKEQS